MTDEQTNQVDEFKNLIARDKAWIAQQKGYCGEISAFSYIQRVPRLFDIIDDLQKQLNAAHLLLQAARRDASFLFTVAMGAMIWLAGIMAVLIGLKA